MRHFDRAMPAVARLQKLAQVLADGVPDEQEFVFWLPEGSRSLTCACRRIRMPGNDAMVLLQVLPTGPAMDQPPQPGIGAAGPAGSDLNGHAVSSHFERPVPVAPELAPQDAATLAEIARMIRERSGSVAGRPLVVLSHTVTEPPKSPPAQELRPGEPEFLGHLSHELRTPLNAIIGYSELLQAEQSGPLGSPKYRAYASDILEAARHCVSLVNDLFDMTRLAVGERKLEFSEVDVNETARVCLGIVFPIAAKAGVALDTDLAPNLPLAILDRRGLRQILLNLLGNAIKFTPPDGVVSISSSYEIGVGLKVAVADTGAGMSSSSLEVARGTSTAASAAASGLGLPISRSIAAANGGRLDVESKTGSGTHVTLFLPMNRLLLR